MKHKTLLEVLKDDEGSVEAALASLAELCEELRHDRLDGWENTNLLQFLEAMYAWLETMGPRVGERPSWKFVEAMLRAAKIYE